MEDHRHHDKKQDHNKKEGHKEHRVHHRKKNAKLPRNLLTWLGALLIIFAIYNFIQVSSFTSVLNEKIVLQKQAAIPAKVGLITLTTSECEECSDIKSVVDSIESTGVNITTNKVVDFDSEEAANVIAKYDIGRLPAVVVIGEVNKSSKLLSLLHELGEEKNGNYVINAQIPPFIETATNLVRGKVSLIHLKKDSCEDCIDLTPIISQLELSGITIEDQEDLSVDSTKGKELLQKYSIKKVPVLLLSDEAKFYSAVTENWEQVGTREKDGTFVMRARNSPFYDLEKDRTVGLVSMKILSDKSCGDCYDGMAFHKGVIQRMGIAIDEELELDVSSKEGKELITEFKIKEVPTIVLTGDMAEYPVLVNAWEGVGSVEDDGTYVFRRVEVAQQPYKNLETGKIVTPSAPTQ